MVLYFVFGFLVDFSLYLEVFLMGGGIILFFRDILILEEIFDVFLYVFD